ncbi:MAG: homogentisate 1,2-dioxygenase [Bryobacteraceae bacterium]
MPIYHTLGQTPRKRHMIFRQTNGALYTEELMGNEGFSGLSSLLYRVHPPTAVKAVKVIAPAAPDAAPDDPMRHRHFHSHRLRDSLSVVTDRVPLLFNADVSLWFAQMSGENAEFYRNAQADEIVYVSHGGGVLESAFGNLAFKSGDYLVIPRGILHRYRLNSSRQRMLIVESTGFVRTPKRYRNAFGQLTENSPFSERDIRRPTDLETHTETGNFRVIVKKSGVFSELILAHHPFDVAGWDGYYYPWAISIHDFEPRVGRFHLPPPIHQIFEGDGFVVCSFCPRPYDFDPESIPAPYNHTNVMSDEVLYYANAEFMSRTGIEYGSVTLHPDGLAHGPQPGRTEASIGKKHTNELAVMVDTFRSLRVSRQALDVEDKEYYRSWLTK